MVNPLDLADIQALAASGAYGGQRSLSAESAATILSAGVWLSALTTWQGAGYELTEAEIDDIQAMVALLQYEVMTEDGGGSGEMQKLEEKVYTSDIAEPYLDDYALEDWIRFQLVVQGMRTNYASNWPDTVEVEYNDIDNNNAYSSYNQFDWKTGQTKYEQIQNYPANLCYWVAAAELDDDDMYGCMKLDIYNPRIVGAKHAQMCGSVMGLTANKISRTTATHGIFAAQKLYKILLRPLNGTTFVVGGSGEPDELRLTLYGWE